MPIAHYYNAEKKQLAIRIQGRFDFHLQKEFRHAYERVDGKVEEYTVDLSETKYIDSSALGMMLLLKEYADKNNAEIYLYNIGKEVEEILKLANFEQLFKVK